MSDPASVTVKLFSEALQCVPQSWSDRQKTARRLIQPDPLERLIPSKLLAEGLGHLLKDMALPSRPVILFMDRLGGGDGARASASLMPMIGKFHKGASFVHVSFATPYGGLGTLVRTVLKHAGANHAVDVQVVIHNRPAEGLAPNVEDTNWLLSKADLVITFAPAGVAGLRPIDSKRDLLLERSHLAVLSYPDPEALVAELPALYAIIKKEPSVDAIKFSMQIQGDQGEFTDLDHTTLSEDGDAEERLWVLLENARHHCYRVLMEPMYHGTPTGDPLVCPCGTLIKSSIASVASVTKVIPAGTRLVAVARGKQTFS